MQFNWLRWLKRTKISQRPDNPYVTGNSVGGSPAFIGRTDILQAVDNILYDSKQNAIVLFGQRRIGKTSVLTELEAKLPKKGNYQPIYFDLMYKAHQSLEVILNDLADTICQQINEEKPQWENTTHQFHKWLAELLESDKLSKQSLVLLFDEFDALNDTQAEQKRDEFFSYLRADLLQIDLQRLNFIFAIGRNIDDFKAALALFKNITSYRVSLLTDKETDKLIRLSEKNQSLYWSHKTIKKIWEITHGHPLLTQSLCSCIWQHILDQNQTYIPTVTSTQIIAENISCVFNQKGQIALEWLWDGLPPACKIVTAAFAEELGKKTAASQKELIEHLYASGIGTVIDELETAPKNLKEWDIIEGDAQKGYCFRVELFRQWVLEHKPLKEIMQKELGRIRIESDQYYQEGHSFYQNKQFDEAIDKLSTAIRIHSHHIDAQKFLAKVLVEQGKIVEAQTTLEKFYQYYPDAARPRLTELLWQQVDSSTNRKEQLTLSEQILQYDSTHSNAKTKRTEILQWQGQRLEEDEEYEKAIEVYRKAGLEDKVRELWWKVFWNKYSKFITFSVVFFVMFCFSFVVSFFKNEITVSFELPIPWWLWGLVLGIMLYLLVVITEKILFKKRTTKQKY
ncbi:MAG: AAA family ATPase [Candidatus Parabeggiatoa sp.]|nr:AAA family ATPase [Candidatus Parabeggiatoa sp.]